MCNDPCTAASQYSLAACIMIMCVTVTCVQRHLQAIANSAYALIIVEALIVIIILLSYDYS